MNEEPVEEVNKKIRKLKKKEIKDLGIDSSTFNIEESNTSDLSISLTSLNENSFIPTPKYVGFWIIGGNFRIQSVEKPNLLTRFLMKHLLSITWQSI